MFFPVKGPNGVGIFPIKNDGAEGRWRCGPAKVEKLRTDGELDFEFDGKHWQILKKIREGRTTYTAYGTLLENVGTTADGTKVLQELFAQHVMDFPKPPSLIEFLIELATWDDTNGIVLDFFAGSCSTAHATINLNTDDDSDRKFIMIQLPEKTPVDSIANKTGYDTIAEIGKERIRRVLKIKKTEKTKGDLGFKVFKLNHSNYKAWEDYKGEDVNQLEMLFEGAETPLVEDWTPESLLTEVMLLQGFPLDSTISVLPECKQNKIKIVTAQAIEHRLLTCLDDKISEDSITHLKFNDGDIFVCLDSAVTDQAKMRLANKCVLRTI